MLIRTYLMAVEGIALDAIKRAARRFIAGEVPHRNNSFAPSCAEFAEQCRHQALVADAEHKAGMRPKIEAPKDDGQRVPAGHFKLLNAALQGDSEARAELQRMYPDLRVWQVADMRVEHHEGETA